MSVPITDVPEVSPNPAFNRTVVGAALPAAATGHRLR
jgi:hypothetical protein